MKMCPVCKKREAHSQPWYTMEYGKDLRPVDLCEACDRKREAAVRKLLRNWHKEQK